MLKNLLQSLAMTVLKYVESVSQFLDLPWCQTRFISHTVQYSPLTNWVVGGFSAGDHQHQSGHGQRHPFFDMVHPTFFQPTMAFPTLQGVLKDGSGEAVVAHDMA